MNLGLKLRTHITCIQPVSLPELGQLNKNRSAGTYNMRCRSREKVVTFSASLPPFLRPLFICFPLILSDSFCRNGPGIWADMNLATNGHDLYEQKG